MRPPPEGLAASGVAAWSRLFAPAIAHRGLWRPEGPPENSLPAFEAARAAGFGIELDVRLSIDGEPMVFHDAELERKTGQPGLLARRTAAELGAMRLAGGETTIPTLRETLALIAGRVLVLVELKTSLGGEGPLEAAVATVLDGYDGPAAVIGFNPLSHAWFAEHRPGVPRGLNSYAYAAAGDRLSPEQRAALAGFETIAVARPHFILPGLDILEREPTARLRAQGLPVVAWTVRTPEQRRAAAAYADNLIFEGDGRA